MTHARKLSIILAVLLVLSAGASSTTAAQSNDVQWYGFEEGLAKSKSEGKIVYIHFYSEICQYCKEMDMNTFQDKKVVKLLNDRFVPIRIDSDKNYKIAYKFNIRPVPDNWFLNGSGERVYRQLGYIDARSLSSVLTKIQRKAVAQK